MIGIINNKKGAFLSDNAGWLILMVLVLGLLVWAAWDIFTAGTGPIDTFPSALAAQSEVCKNLVKNQFAFCEYKEINIKEEDGVSLVNCEHPNPDFQAVLKDISGKPKCEVTPLARCKTLTETQQKETFVNGMKCTDLIVEEEIKLPSDCEKVTSEGVCKSNSICKFDSSTKKCIAGN